MSGNRVPTDIGQPHTFPITIASSTIDLTTITGVTFNVELPDKTTTTWSGFIVSQTKTLIVVAHAFQMGDCPQLGDMMVEPLMTTANIGDLIRADAVSLRVTNDFGN